MGGIIPLIKSGATSTEDEAGQVNVRKHSLYALYGKRSFDAAFSAAALLFSSPLFWGVALLLKFLSPGPIFYLQRRVGKDSRDFFIVKFRTMVVGADRSGAGITVKGDARITRFGRYLRLTKLDELPQLWNVLKGEMSLVGPRPELPCYVANYSDSQREVLSIRPGITDAASLYYRHEESILAVSANPEAHYRNEVLPHKLQLNKEYLHQISFGYDIALIYKTLKSIFVNPSTNVRH